MSSMLSAPAPMPATSDNPALVPLSVGTLRCSSPSSRSPALRARPISGTRPADDTRFGSSKTAETTGRVWESCIYEIPFLTGYTDLRQVVSSQFRGAFSRSRTHPRHPVHQWIEAKVRHGVALRDRLGHLPVVKG